MFERTKNVLKRGRGWSIIWKGRWEREMKWDRFVSKMDHPRPLFRLFSVFFKQTSIQVYNKLMWKMPPITTRPELPPNETDLLKWLLLLNREKKLNWKRESCRRRLSLMHFPINIGCRILHLRQRKLVLKPVPKLVPEQCHVHLCGQSSQCPVL